MAWFILYLSIGAGTPHTFHQKKLPKIKFAFIQKKIKWKQNEKKNCGSTTIAFGQATLTIPGANISIPLAANSLGNLTTHNATNATAGQAGQQQQQAAQTNQQANQTTANANAQNQQTQQSVNFKIHTKKNRKKNLISKYQTLFN